MRKRIFTFLFCALLLAACEDAGAISTTPATPAAQPTHETGSNHDESNEGAGIIETIDPEEESGNSVADATEAFYGTGDEPDEEVGIIETIDPEEESGNSVADATEAFYGTGDEPDEEVGTIEAIDPSQPQENSPIYDDAGDQESEAPDAIKEVGGYYHHILGDGTVVTTEHDITRYLYSTEHFSLDETTGEKHHRHLTHLDVEQVVKDVFGVEAVYRTQTGYQFPDNKGSIGVGNADVNEPNLMHSIYVYIMNADGDEYDCPAVTMIACEEDDPSEYLIFGDRNYYVSPDMGPLIVHAIEEAKKAAEEHSGRSGRDVFAGIKLGGNFMPRVF